MNEERLFNDPYLTHLENESFKKKLQQSIDGINQGLAILGMLVVGMYIMIFFYIIFTI